MIRPVSDRVVAGRRVGAVGLGGAGWSLGAVERSTAVATLHAALDHGVRLIDTALAYSTVDEPHHNERLVAEALSGRAEQPFVVTKGGHYRGSAIGFPIDGRPATLRAHCIGSRSALSVDRLDLYLLHHPDPKVSITESVRALRDLHSEGLIQAIGLSNVSLEQLDAALEIAPIEAVENRFSALDRTDEAMIGRTADLGIAYLAYSPLGGPGALAQRPADFTDMRAIAAANEVSLQVLLLTWLLQHAPHVLPVVGAGSPSSIRDSASAASSALDDDALAELDAAVRRFPFPLD